MTHLQLTAYNIVDKAYGYSCVSAIHTIRRKRNDPQKPLLDTDSSRYIYRSHPDSAMQTGSQVWD